VEISKVMYVLSDNAIAYDRNDQIMSFEKCCTVLGYA
jgi:hypothetical protein